MNPISGEQDRLKDNLAKAFSLLDDDKPNRNQINADVLYGGERIGTAPAGGM